MCVNNDVINTAEPRENGYDSVIRSRTIVRHCDQLTGQCGACSIINKQQIRHGNCDAGAEPHKIKSPEGTFKVVPGGEGVFAGTTRNVGGCTSNSASEDSKLIKKMMNDLVSTSDWWIGDCESGYMKMSILERQGTTPKTFCVNLDCVSGTCTCIHIVSGCVCQLKL